MGKKVPKPPNLKPISDAQIKIADQMNATALEQLGLSKEQFAYFKEQGAAELAFAKEQSAKQLELQDRAIATGEAGQRTQDELAAKQQKLMDQAYGFSEEDRQRYRDVAIPLQDRIIDEANNWDSPERQAQQAAMMQADVQRQADAQQRNVDARLSGMGIDPSQMRSGAIANTMALQTAAMGAQAGNTGRQQTQQQAIGMRGQAANMIAGLPSQGAQQQGIASGAGGAASNASSAGQSSAQNGYGMGSNLGNSAVGLRGSALNNMASWTGTPTQWAGMGNNSMGMSSNSLMNAGNVLNSGYGNQMTQYNAQRQQFNDILNAGTAIGSAMLVDGGDTDDKSLKERFRANWKEKGERTSQERLEDAIKTHEQMSQGQGEAIAPENDIQQVMYADGGNTNAGIKPRQSVDRIDAKLSKGEFVVPADVVRALGTRHFEKLVDKYHRIGN